MLTNHICILIYMYQKDMLTNHIYINRYVSRGFGIK